MVLITTILLLCIALMPLSGQSYEPNWSSLRQHQTPEWMEDAKFGIYCHWGLSTLKQLPGNEDKNMRELIPLFKAENFDPAEWAQLFKDAGAQFAGPVAWHSSGYLHWDSEHTPWNTMDMGPGIDIVGSLESEIKKRGMKFLTSYHFGYHYGFPHWGDDPEYRNPDYEGLYGPVTDTAATDVVKWKNHIEKQEKMNKDFMTGWLAKMNEAIGKYDPDIVWVDVSFGGTVRAKNIGLYTNGRLMDKDDIYLGGIRQDFQQTLLAGFYNHGEEAGKQVEFVYKEHDIPPGIGMRNMENGLLRDLAYDAWMTDIDINIHEPGTSWFYKEGGKIKSADYIIDALADVVSKNGRMLLNVPPKADGTFSDEIRHELLEVGAWLKLNGEAIYGTMPWVVYGEGATEMGDLDHYSEGLNYTTFGAADIRYTVSGMNLYAICLGWPGEELVLRALGSRGKLFPGEIRTLELLGSEKEISWTQEDYQLTIEMPEEQVSDYAVVIKMELN